ncbi:hypothetical protein EV144_101253 [Flavobacterium sp. 270]|uniref:hypothetical protein n=1 Tax=Flavobacterium sp. 270 TaxID=2512114 RepID=UPI001064CBA5|nr:hypothetical protein [Flavobacterium sp. 270]TDW51577.1 hypothetical protein EV144_101253 [Flavobacterium sp. 270]
MIPIKFNNSNVSQYYKKIDTTDGNYKSISSKLQKWINANSGNSDIDIARDIKKKLKSIITSTPKGLELIINEYNTNGFQSRVFDPALGKNGELTSIGKALKDIFNYKSFRQSKKAIWFSDSLSIKSCATCNSQYTLKTSQIKSVKLLFHLDHYFPKSVYPYLSLSYYNLIPCCASCNMSKSNKPFSLLENIHPYIESFHNIAKFNLDRASLADFLIDPNKNEDKINYCVEIRAKYFGNSIFETKLENYLREFRINEQYEQFKDIASETYLRSRYYHKKRRNEVRDFFHGSGINIDDELFRRFVLGNYHQDKDLLKRPLAKFMRDIGEDLNMF